ncbi:MAG: acyltransferase [Synergistes sp.]|nr:acyltransferase [Synergistes sp.]
MEKKNYNCIDAVRFACALFVIMIHIPPMGDASYGSAPYLVNFALQNVLARIAVPFFYVTTGFFLFRENEDADPYAKKLLRMYLLWTLIYLPLIIRSFLQNDTGFGQDILLFIRNSIFSGSFEILWYLPAGIFAVLLVSCLLRRGMRPLSIAAAAFVFYLAGLLAQSWFGLITPLEHAAPGLWHFLLIVKQVICTTRDGLFDAFPFVAMGMYIQREKPSIKRKTASAGFLISLVLLFIEAFGLEAAGFIREYDMYLSLIPALFFGFVLAADTELPAGPRCSVLRPVSALMYYTHYWIACILALLLRYMAPAKENTAAKFVLTIPMTILAAFMIVRLSRQSPFRWLRKLYS